MGITRAQLDAARSVFDLIGQPDKEQPDFDSTAFYAKYMTAYRLGLRCTPTRFAEIDSLKRKRRSQ